MIFDFSRIKNSKNLLAFSGGVDSSALFFLLLNHKIDFDIAIVNYNTREQSKDEIAYALNLAKEYKKEIFIKSDFNLDIIEIFYLNGRFLSKQKVENNKINIQNINSGIYFLKINMNGNYITKRIIIE